MQGKNTSLPPLHLVLFFIIDAARAATLPRTGEGLLFEEDFCMNKKFLVVGMAAILGASLVFLGCESATGSDGSAGAPGPIYLSGPQTTAGIQAAIDSGAPLVFAGVTQSNAGTVIIPAGRNVELVGTAAYTTMGTTGGGILIVEDVSSVTGTGVLVSGAATSLVIAPPEVSTGTTNSGVVVPLQDGSEPIAPAAKFAVKGPVTISGSQASATNILATGFNASDELYVIGDVEVSSAISAGTPTITVTGNATVKTTDQTAAVVWDIKGDLDAQKLPTTGAGTITVGGDATFAEAVAGIAGTIDIGDNAEFKDALTTGAGKLTVSGDLEVTGAATIGAGGAEIAGNATFSDTLGTTASGTVVVSGNLNVDKAATLNEALTVHGRAEFKDTLTCATATTATFNGPTTIADTVTASTALAIAGTGAVTLKKAPVTGAVALTVKNTAGVTLEEATVIAANITATNVTVKGDASTGTAIKSSDTGLTVGSDTANSIVVLANGSIVAGTGADTVTITGATLGAGTYTAGNDQLSLTTTAVITVDGGIDIAGGGDLALDVAATKVIFNENSYLDVKDAAGQFGEASQGDTKVSVTGAAGNGKATVVKGAGNEWTITDDATGTAAVTVILGTLKLALTGTSAITNIAGTDASGEAAPGKLIAGPGTTITFGGTG
jgi:hypothetical protein